MKTIALTAPNGNHLEITQVAQHGSNQEVYWKKWQTAEKVDDEFTAAVTGSDMTGTLDALLEQVPADGLTISEAAIEAGYAAILGMEKYAGWTAVRE
jgi:hypothetical protein